MSNPTHSPSTQGTPPISDSVRPEASPALQRNISNSNDDAVEQPVRPRPLSARRQGSAASTPQIMPTTSTAPSSSIPALTGLPLQTRNLHSDANTRLLFSSPDTGNFESSLPPRGPLNQNITMGPHRQTSTSSEASFMSTRSLPSAGSFGSLAFPGTPLLQAARLPDPPTGMQQRSFTDEMARQAPPPFQSTYKPRTRKIHTKEAAPDDIQAVVDLGMAPFMIGQDAMANQNRLVRNEAILTRHVLRLQRAFAESESVHARREEDIYRILQEHKASINSVSVADNNAGPGASSSASAGIAHAPSSSLRNDPDFIALFEAQADMRRRLDHLIADVAASTLSNKLALESLDERIRQLASAIPTLVPPTPTSTPLLGHDTPLGPRFARGDVSTERPARKRKRDEWFSSATPTRGELVPEHRSNSRPHHSRGHWSNVSPDDNALDVIYGPIASPARASAGGSSSNYADDDDEEEDDRDAWSSPRIKMIAKEALRDVGLSPSMIHSVRRAHDAPDFITIRFMKYEHAVRFIELVRVGRDEYSERRARLVESAAPMWGGEGPAEQRAPSGSRAASSSRVASGSNVQLWD